MKNYSRYVSRHDMAKLDALAKEELTRKGIKQDAINSGVGAGLFFARQLEYIFDEVLRKHLPPLNGFRLFEVDTRIPEGAESYTKTMYEYVGEAGFVNDYAADAPSSDVNARQMSYRCDEISTKYGYSVQDIAGAQMNGMSLDSEKGLAARRMIDEKHNRILWYGDTKRGLYGVTNFPRTPRVPLAVKIDSSASAANIYAALQAFVDGVKNRTNQAERATRLILPTAEYNYIHGNNAGDGTDMTIAQKLLSNVKSLETIEEANELAPDANDSRNPLTRRLIIADNPGIKTWRYAMPRPFTQRPAQERNLAFVIPCHSRSGGCYSEYPFSGAIGEIPA